MALWDRVLSFFAGEAAGAAAGKVVEPAFEVTRQNASARRPYAVLDPTTAAEAEARGAGAEQTFTSLNEHGDPIQHSTWAKTDVDFADDAVRNMVGPARFDVLRRLARKVPPYAEVLTLWRRGRVDEATVDSVLDWEAIPEGLRPALKELFDEKLDPETLANAVQQSFIPNAGLLSDPVDGPPFDIPLESVPIETLKEFGAAGINKDRAQVLAYLSGNPPAPDQLANMVLRGEISAETFIHGLREGRTKTKWAKALLYYLTHPLLTPGTLVNRRLKGYDDAETFHRRMANYGYTAQQADDWWESAGRPAAPGQMATAAARGIDGPDNKPMDFAQFAQGIKESDIKEKYARMLWETRFLYPPLFQITRLVQAGAIDAATAKEWAIKDRYPPEVVSALHAYWLTLGGSTTDVNVKKAQTQLWTATHRSFIAGETDEATAVSNLTTLGVPAEARSEVVALWTLEQDLVRKQLTPAQIKKGFDKAAINDATGQPWTHDDALAALLERGYSGEQARSYLNLPAAK